MRLLVGLDDTDSSRGACTTYLAYRIAVDLAPEVRVLPYPRLVRLNPNIPFKTRGNAAVCLEIEAEDPDAAFESISSKVGELSDVEGGANSGMVMLERPKDAGLFQPLYQKALSGVVGPHSVRRLLRDNGVRSFELGNGMGVVGAASSLGFSTTSDHTFELIAYRRKESWGTKRTLDGPSVERMDRMTFPRTFNSYDYQKKKLLVAPHGPDPVFVGVRGDSPSTVALAFRMLEFEEKLDGFMVYASNQHTDAHLERQLEWKPYSSGWVGGSVTDVGAGPGGHVYFHIKTGAGTRRVAAYEPTGDLRRAARLLRSGDRVRAYGGVRRASTLNPEVLNLEKLVVLRAASRASGLRLGTYISSTRSNRHLTKPLVRYGREDFGPPSHFEGWLSPPSPSGVSTRVQARAVESL